jgi:hypothetical protein
MQAIVLPGPAIEDATVWIAVRTLKDAATGAEVTAALARPEQVSEGEWSCAFRVDGVLEGGTGRGHGCDGLQALLVAIEGLQAMLLRSKQSLTWLGGELGETGIPRFTPIAFGLAFRQRVEGMMDDEIARHGEEGRRRSRSGADNP